MGQISSINFKKSTPIQTAHNDRTLAPNYLISDNGCECNRNDDEARTLKSKLIEQAKANYKNKIGQRFQGKNFEWSAVVNIKSDTTMQDLENLAKKFNEKYGFQCYQIAIHRDEGHIDEQGEKIINHHAHLEFVMLDKETGKTCFKLRDFNKQKMREIQTEVSEILQMQRGEDKRISKRERVEPRKFAALKEAEKKEKKQEIEKLSKKKISEELEKVRKSLIGKGYEKSIFRELSSLKQGEYTTDDLTLAIDDILKKYEKDVLVENKTISQSNGNGSKTNENDLNDKSIDQEQKIVLNGLEDDFKLETEIEKKGLLTKSYEIKLIEEFKNPPKIEDLRLFSRIKRKFLDIYQTVKAQAKKIFELESENKELKNQVSFLKAENLKLKRDLKQQVKELSIEALEQSSPKQQKKEIEITEQFNPMQKIRDELKDLNLNENQTNQKKPFKPKVKIQGQNRSNGVDLSW